MTDLNMQLLKQHIAILQTHMESMGRLTDSLSKDAEMLETELDEEDPAAEALDQAQRVVRASEAKLASAVKALHYVMSGGDACKVCGKRCKMGEPCAPVWNGAEGGQ